MDNRDNFTGKQNPLGKQKTQEVMKTILVTFGFNPCEKLLDSIDKDQFYKTIIKYGF